jgi:DnaK suppressor protein
MPGKRPVAKTSKAKKPASAKVPAARRVEPRKPVAASRKAVAATATRPHSERTVGAARPETPSLQPSAPASSPERAPERARLQVLNEVDEGDGNEPGSLLAGPRNVQPYVPKRGEQYMSKEQLVHFQHILLSWKRDLMEEVDRTVSHMKDEAANFPDPNDRATQ